MERLLCTSVCPGGGARRGSGQLSGDHPKQGPNSQLEGLRRRHVALTDQILQIAQRRTGCPRADGRREISASYSRTPRSLLLTSPSETPRSLTSYLTPCLRCLCIWLSVFCLAVLQGPRRCLKRCTLHIRPQTWTAARILSTPLPWPAA